jgi:hypothetical protein
MNLHSSILKICLEQPDNPTVCRILTTSSVQNLLVRQSLQIYVMVVLLYLFPSISIT